MSKLTTQQIAEVCHEANRVYCLIFGDTSQALWSEAAAWQKESAIKGVEFALANPNASPSAQHEAWLEDKRSAGWKYGPVKDPAKLEHPCFLPYSQLPAEQRAKDALFQGIVRALSA